MLNIGDADGERMRTTLIVSERGRITLPALLMKRMGIGNGGVVAIEERGGRLILTPAAPADVEMYTAEEAGQLIRKDAFKGTERKKLDAKLSRRGHI